MPDAPRCFISYSQESPAHSAWVLQLATRLCAAGVDTILDQFHLALGADVMHFMEASVRESQFVLLVCTPTFARKANAGLGGVGYEKGIVTGELAFAEERDTKFVPLLRLGEPREALPTYLRSRLLIDFRQDALFDSNLEHLLRHLHGEPLHPPPPIGRKPDFRSSGATAADVPRADAPRAAESPAASASAAAAVSPAAPAAPSDPGASDLPLFFEGFDDEPADEAGMQARYGEHWTIGRDGPWHGYVRDGVYHLVNESGASAVKYLYTSITRPDGSDLDLRECTVTVQVSVELAPGSPLTGAGVLYRLEPEAPTYGAVLLTRNAHAGPAQACLAWAQRDEASFRVRLSERAPWIAPVAPALLGVTSRGQEIELSVDGALRKTVRADALRGSLPGIVVVGRGHFIFDNFSIWPGA